MNAQSATFPTLVAGAGSRLPRPPPRRIALLGNFLPRLCGIATFTTHVHAALRAHAPDVGVDVYAMVDPGSTYGFPRAVRGTIDQEDRSSYVRAAAAIEASGADLLWIQHEYGIFGGVAGEYLFDLVDNSSIPIAVTLHTVLEQPEPSQRAVIERLAARSSLLIVMAQRARTLLRQIYRVPGHKIAVVEHGVPDRPFVPPALARRRLGMEDRKTVLTFGLLSPGKGIEAMIRAMPEILGHCPEAVYEIVGATHPHLVAREGERYREMLQALARELGVEESLRWENRFVDEEELLDRIAAADVYVTPYRNAQQITSGTLSYAFALGKPIVSTGYVHASELLAQGRGRLIPFDDTGSLAREVGSLLADDAARARMASRAYAYGRDFTWHRMVDRIADAFAGVAAQTTRGTYALPNREPRESAVAGWRSPMSLVRGPGEIA